MKKNLILLCVSLVIGLVLVEFGLRAFTRFPVTSRSNKRPHARFLYTLDPSLGDINQNGFRNKQTYSGEPIIAIGDSHTYGSFVAASQSWPSLFEKKVGKRVYNLGIPSYHIYTYVVLAEEALQRKAEVVIIGLHPATDFSLTICPTLDLDYWKKRVRVSPELTNKACSSSENPSTPSWLLFDRRSNSTAVVDFLAYTIWNPFLRPLRTDLRAKVDRWWYDPKERIFMNVGNETTALRFRKIGFYRRSLNMDLSRKKVRESYKNGKILFSEINKKADQQNVFLGFLIFPSMERVVYEWAQRKEKPLPKVATKTGVREREITRRFIQFLETSSIEYVDVTDTMVQAFDRSLRDGDPIYTPPDDHPDRRGFDVYADAAMDLLRQADHSPSKASGSFSGSGNGLHLPQQGFR